MIKLYSNREKYVLLLYRTISTFMPYQFTIDHSLFQHCMFPSYSFPSSTPTLFFSPHPPFRQHTDQYAVVSYLQQKQWSCITDLVSLSVLLSIHPLLILHN